MLVNQSSEWRSYLTATSVRIVRIFVTWQIAEQMLTLNERNRSVSEKKVKEYGDLMEHGQWTPDHPDTISFTRDGKLINGQHRLMAMVRRKQDLLLNVAFGCADEAKLTVDGHRSKSVGDRLWIAGCAIPIKSSTEARRMSELIVRMMQGPSNTKDLHKIEDIDLFIQQHPDAITFTLQLFGGKTRGRLTTAPVKAVIARAYYHIALDRVRRFVEVMLSGEADLRAASVNERVIILARNWLLEGRYAYNSNAAGEIYRRLARALQAFVNNESLKQLKDISYDPFPLPTTSADLEPHRMARTTGQLAAGGQGALEMATTVSARSGIVRG